LNQKKRNQKGIEQKKKNQKGIEPKKETNTAKA